MVVDKIFRRGGEDVALRRMVRVRLLKGLAGLNVGLQVSVWLSDWQGAEAVDELELPTADSDSRHQFLADTEAHFLNLGNRVQLT